MNVFCQVVFGKECIILGGCEILIRNLSESNQFIRDESSTENHLTDTKLHSNRLIRLIKTNKDFFFLLNGTMFLTYGDSESFCLSSPYTSAEFVDYIDKWNYDENFSAKCTSSTVFLYMHAANIEPVTVKVAVLEPGSTVKSINSNSKLILVKDENATCVIDDIQYTDNRKLIEIENLTAKDVNITVSEKSYLIYLQS